MLSFERSYSGPGFLGHEIVLKKCPRRKNMEENEAALVQRRESVARPELHQKSNVGAPTARKKQSFAFCVANLSML
jgi:hypothetical protein